jgi:integrase/recombinase XerD
LHFLRYRDNVGRSRNTLRATCYRLKLFWEFLETQHLSYENVTLDDLAQFKGWLRSGSRQVISVHPDADKRSPRTLNLYVDTVLQFYDYVARQTAYAGGLPHQAQRWMPGSLRGFRPFLSHVSRGRRVRTNILRSREPRTRVTTLSKDQVTILYAACQNHRDRLLVQLLWEAGMRIGEALSLWLEDFEIDGRRVHLRDRGELENLAEIKTVASPRTLDVTPDLMNQFMAYVEAHHTTAVNANHVFIKLAGSHGGEAMDYEDARAVFRRLGSRTGLHVWPHVLRHSSLHGLRQAGWPIEQVAHRAGHKNVQTTYRFYVHPTDEELHASWRASEAKMKLHNQAGELDE